MLPVISQFNLILSKFTTGCPRRCGFLNNILTKKFSKDFKKRHTLEGIKVLDLTRVVAGPFCTMLLGDLGADVIKIEEPGLGDVSRHWGPTVKGTDYSCYFMSLNRNKTSICVNFKSARGKSLVTELAKRCDVLVENYIPGKLDEIGLGYETLKEIAPKLIYCSVTGFGSTGPYKGRPGVDVIVSSIGGLLDVTGPEGGAPCKPGVPMADLTTGLYAHGAILAALLEREKSGLGQKIDCNLLSSQISCLLNVAYLYLNMNIESCRMGTAHGNIVPYQSFTTEDGYLTIGAINQSQFHELCKALSLESLCEDERFTGNHQRVKNKDVLIQMFTDVISRKPTKDWLEIFKQYNFPYGPVNSINEVFQDSQVQDLGLVQDVQLEGGEWIKAINPAVQFSNAMNDIRLPPPRLGQHTSSILSSVLNISTSEQEKLFQNGVVQ